MVAVDHADLTLLFKNSANAFVLLGLDGSVLWANESAQSLADTFEDRSFWDRVLSRVGQAASAQFTIESVASNRLYACEVTQLREAFGVQLREHQPEQDLPTAIVDSTFDAVVVYQLDGTITDWNRSAERKFGWRKNEALGRNVHLLLHTDAASGLSESNRELMRDGVWEGEVSHTTRYGVTKTLLARWQLVEGDSHEETRIIEVARDITARMDTDAALRRSEQRYRSLMFATHDAVWSTDPKGAVIEPQLLWQAYTGQTVDEVLGYGAVNAVHPDDRSQVVAAFRTSIRRRSKFQHELRLWSAKHQEYRRVISKGIPVLRPNGSVSEWVGSVLDIENQRAAEQALAEARDFLEEAVLQRTAELQAANRELEGFTYSVSHDLRGPLRAIGSMGRILRDDFSDNLPEEAHRLIDRQCAAASKLGTLIDELLQLARISRQELAIQRFDLSAIAQDIADELRERKWTHPLSFAIEQGLEAEGDPRLLRLVLQNLFENACKFSPNGGTIAFGSRNGVFFVSDEGIGFDMRFESKLWRPFERLVLDHEFPGTGIGLANVQRIIDRHHGKIWAESEPGRGSTFWFRI